MWHTLKFISQLFWHFRIGCLGGRCSHRAAITSCIISKHLLAAKNNIRTTVFWGVGDMICVLLPDHLRVAAQMLTVQKKKQTENAWMAVSYLATLGKFHDTECTGDRKNYIHASIDAEFCQQTVWYNLPMPDFIKRRSFYIKYMTTLIGN